MSNTPYSREPANRYRAMPNNTLNAQTKTPVGQTPSKERQAARAPKRPITGTARRSAAPAYGEAGRMQKQARPGPACDRCALPLAMAWFEDQKIDAMYAPEYGMDRGTLFPELDKPWLPKEGGR